MANSVMVTPSADSAEQPAESKRLGMFAAFQAPAFRWLIAGTTLSNAGQWIQQVTLGWLVYDMTGSGAALGAINLVRSISSLGLGPFSGLAIDRFPRKALMYVVNGWLFVISAILGLALLSGQRELWWLYLFTFCGGAAQSLDMPLRQTLVFSTVPRTLAPNAVALIQTGWAIMRSIGPAIGGVLILAFGPGGNFLVQATAYALIMITILRLRLNPAPPRPAGTGKGSLMEGVRFVATQPTTRAFALMGLALPILIVPNYVTMTPIINGQFFGGSPGTLGLLTGAVGIGGIVGGMAAASLGSYERRGRIQIAGLFGFAVSLAALAFTTELWTAMLAYGFTGLFEMLFMTNNQALLQLSVPDSMRGRVTGILSLNFALMPVGATVAGFLSDQIGPRAVTLVLAAGMALVALGVLLFSSTIRDYRLSAALTGEHRAH